MKKKIASIAVYRHELPEVRFTLCFHFIAGLHDRALLNVLRVFK